MLALCFGDDLGQYVGDEFDRRHGTDVSFAALPHGDGVRFDLFVADDEHVGDFLHLAFADLVADFFCAVINFTSFNWKFNDQCRYRSKRRDNKCKNCLSFILCISR